MKVLFFIASLFFLLSCNSAQMETKVNDEISSKDFKSVDTALIKTTKLFTAATEQYIKKFYTTEKPDTLFLSRNPEFPDITLPESIEGIPIRVIVEEEGHKISKRRPMTILNLVDLGMGEFMIVTFKDGFHPQHNCHMYFSSDKNNAEFFMDSLRMEYPYIKDKNQ